MTRLYDASVGEYFDFTRKLAEAGLTSEEIKEVLRKPELAKEMVAWLREQLAPPTPQLLLSPEQQLENIRRWNGERGWSFSEREFAAVDTTLTDEQTLNRVVVLVPVSRDMGSAVGVGWTFDELAAIAAAQHPNQYRNSDLKSDAAHLRLHPLAKAYPRGIHRVVLDLTAHHEPANGRTVTKVRERATAAAQQLSAIETLAAAAHFSEWVRIWDGDTYPYPDLAGYEYRFDETDDSEEAWYGLPCLGWWRGDREFSLSLGGVRSRYFDYAAPVVRES